MYTEEKLGKGIKTRTTQQRKEGGTALWDQALITLDSRGRFAQKGCLRTARRRT